MNEQKIRDTGRKIVADILGITFEECTDSAILDDDLGADSLDAAEILMTVEKECGGFARYLGTKGGE